MDSVETQPFPTAAFPGAQKGAEPTPATPEELSRFVGRHIGPNDDEVRAMLGELGFENLDEFITATVPQNIRLTNPFDLPTGKSATCGTSRRWAVYSM